MDLPNPKAYIRTPNHLHAFLRSWIDSEGSCFIDGIRVPVFLYEEFNQYWSRWYVKKYPNGSGHRCNGWCWVNVFYQN